mmetsp:Transcript_17831/g.40849  ORF Transcript_17831/g.40849 Transcript_17831/m.40849 type:complete len:408 (+) Transcript_17831:343-1566(+)
MDIARECSHLYLLQNAEHEHWYLISGSATSSGQSMTQDSSTSKAATNFMSSLRPYLATRRKLLMPSITYAAGSGSRVERPRSDGVGMMVIWRMALPSARTFTSAVLANLTAGLLIRSWDCRQSPASITGVLAKFSEEKCEVTPNHVSRRLMKPVPLSPTGSISRKVPASLKSRIARSCAFVWFGSPGFSAPRMWRPLRSPMYSASTLCAKAPWPMSSSSVSRRDCMRDAMGRWLHSPSNMVVSSMRDSRRWMCTTTSFFVLPDGTFKFGNFATFLLKCTLSFTHRPPLFSMASWMASELSEAPYSSSTSLLSWIARITFAPSKSFSMSTVICSAFSLSMSPMPTRWYAPLMSVTPIIKRTKLSQVTLAVPSASSIWPRSRSACLPRFSRQHGVVQRTRTVSSSGLMA